MSTIKKLGFTFEIKSKDTVKNNGIRAIAKLILNNLWGKFGQSTDLDNREFVNNYNTLTQRITNNDIATRELNIINENCVEHVYKAKNESVKDAGYISETTAVFTTSNARLRLYNMLSCFHPSQKNIL